MASTINTSDLRPTEIEFDSTTDTIDLLNRTNSLVLTSEFDENSLISEISFSWVSKLSLDIFDTVQSDLAGINPAKLVINSSGLQNNLIYGESTTTSISRPKFTREVTFDYRTYDVEYSNTELLALSNVYQKEDLQTSINNLVLTIASNVSGKTYEKSNGFTFQKSKSLNMDISEDSETTSDLCEDGTSSTGTVTTTSGTGTSATTSMSGY